MTDQITPDESGTEPDAQPQTFPAEYVAQLREEAKAGRLQTKALQAQIDKINADNEAAANAKLEQQGEFQKIAEQRAAEIERLKVYETKVKTFEETTSAANAAFIESIPEERRTLIPAGMDALTLQAYLQTNRELLIGTSYTPPWTNGGAGTRRRGETVITKEQLIANKRAAGTYSPL